MMTNKYQEKLVDEGAKLKHCVNELKERLETLQHAPLWDRNPYLISSTGKKNVRALEAGVTECIDMLLFYTAALSAAKVCEKQELHAYFFVYDFLFQFQDDILCQEYAHRLLTRDVELTSRFHEFFRYTVLFVEHQNEKLWKLYKEEGDFRQ